MIAFVAVVVMLAVVGFGLIFVDLVERYCSCASCFNRRRRRGVR